MSKNDIKQYLSSTDFQQSIQDELFKKIEDSSLDQELFLQNKVHYVKSDELQPYWKFFVQEIEDLLSQKQGNSQKYSFNPQLDTSPQLINLTQQLRKDLQKKLQQNNFCILFPKQSANSNNFQSNKDITYSLVKRNISIIVKAHTQNSQILQFFCQYGNFSKRYFALNQSHQSVVHHTCKVIGVGNMGKAYKKSLSAYNYDCCQKLKCQMRQIQNTAIKCSRYMEGQLQLSLLNFLSEFFIGDIMSALQIGPNIKGSTSNLLNKLSSGVLQKQTTQFDFFIYKNCFEFEMELCKMLDFNKNIQCVKQKEKQLRRSLLALHSLQITHNDIKPSNILYSEIYKKLVFIDFGISEILKAQIGQKTLTPYIGTYLYSGKQIKKLMNKGEKAWVDLYKNDVETFQNSFKQIRKNMMKQYSSLTITENKSQEQLTRQKNAAMSIHHNFISHKFKYLIFKHEMNEQILVKQLRFVFKQLRHIQIHTSWQLLQLFKLIQQLVSYCLHEFRMGYPIVDAVNQLCLIRKQLLTHLQSKGDRQFLQFQNSIKQKQENIQLKSLGSTYSQNYKEYIVPLDPKKTLSEYFQGQIIKADSQKIKRKQKGLNTVAYKNFVSILKVSNRRIIYRSMYRNQNQFISYTQIQQKKSQIKTNTQNILFNLENIMGIQVLDHYLKLLHQYICTWTNFYKAEPQQKLKAAQVFFKYLDILKDTRINLTERGQIIRQQIKNIQKSSIFSLIQISPNIQTLKYIDLQKIYKYLLAYCYQFSNQNLCVQFSFTVLKDCILLGFQYLGFIQNYLFKIFFTLLFTKENIFITLATIETIQISQLIQQKFHITQKQQSFSYKNEFFCPNFYNFENNTQLSLIQIPSIKKKLEILKNLWIFYNQYLSNRILSFSMIKQIFQQIIRQIQIEFKYFPQQIWLCQKAVKYIFLVSKCFYLKNSEQINNIETFLVYNRQKILTLDDFLDATDFLILRASHRYTYYNSEKHFKELDEKVHFKEISKYLLIDCRLYIAVLQHNLPLISEILSIITVLDNEVKLDQKLLSYLLGTTIFNFQNYSQCVYHYVWLLQQKQKWKLKIQNDQQIQTTIILIFTELIDIYVEQNMESQFYLTVLSLLIQSMLVKQWYLKSQNTTQLNKIAQKIYNNCLEAQRQLESYNKSLKYKDQHIHDKDNLMIFVILFSYMELIRIHKANSFKVLLFSKHLIKKYADYQKQKVKISKQIKQYQQPIQSEAILSYQNNIISTINNLILRQVVLLLKNLELVEKFYQIKILCSKSQNTNLLTKNINYIQYNIIGQNLLSYGKTIQLLNLSLRFAAQQQFFEMNIYEQIQIIKNMIVNLCKSKQINHDLFCQQFFRLIDTQKFYFQHFIMMFNILVLRQYFNENIHRWSQALIKISADIDKYSLSLDKHSKQSVIKLLYFQAYQYCIKVTGPKRKTQLYLKRLIYRIFYPQQQLYQKRIIHNFLIGHFSNYESKDISKLLKILSKKQKILSNIYSDLQEQHANNSFQQKTLNYQPVHEQQGLSRYLQFDSEESQPTIDLQFTHDKLKRLFLNRPILWNNILSEMMHELNVKNLTNISENHLHKFYRITRMKSLKSQRQQLLVKLKSQMEHSQGFDLKQNIVKNIDEILDSFLILAKC